MPETNVETAPVVVVEESKKAEHEQLTRVLSELRHQRDILVGFRAAVESGTYNGHKALDLAKGLSLLDAVLKANNDQIHVAQDRLSTKDVVA